jgi:DNA-binding FrmR family transcriptional regulator
LSREGKQVACKIIVTSGGGYKIMAHMHTHETHPATIKRLRRAGGHLASVIQMLEQGRPCLDVAQQLQAVEKAVAQAKKTLIQDHLDHCLTHMVEGSGEVTGASLEEFRLITKYL